MFFAGNLNAFWGGCGHMVVGFTTTYTMTGWGFSPGGTLVSSTNKTDCM
jgi:hypothetical protein